MSCFAEQFFSFFIVFNSFIPGPSSEHHGSISVPYEISIPKSDITSWPTQDQHLGADDITESSSSRSKLQNSSRTETSAGHPCSQRSSLSLQTAYSASTADCNDTESGFESSSSSTTTVTSWKHQRQSPHPRDDGATDTRSLTVRSTWRNKGAAHVEESGKGKGGKSALADGGSEDDAEASQVWRAYRANTNDTEESISSGTGAGGSTEAQRGSKPSPAEVRLTPQCKGVSLGKDVGQTSLNSLLCFVVVDVHAQNQQCSNKRRRRARVPPSQALRVSQCGSRRRGESHTSCTCYLSVLGPILHATTGTTSNPPCLSR